MKCAVCHEPIVCGFASDPSCHPNHTDAELEPTRRLVEPLAKALTLVVLALMASEAVEP